MASEVREVITAIDSLVMLVGDWVVVNRLQERKFVVEAIFNADTEQRLHDISDIQLTPDTPDHKCLKILLVTKASVWLSLKPNGLKIFCRESLQFINYNMNRISDVKSNPNWVAVLRPESIDLFRHTGKLDYSIRSSSYYTGLTMSHVGVAFLECLDFDDPNAAYINLRTRKKVVIGAQVSCKLKVYGLALFQDTIYCLSGREKFQLSCHESNGNLKKIVSLVGSKFLRPGKDYFEIVCSKYIFVSPAQVRLDVFELYDKDTCDKLFTVSIHTSSYNISQVTDSGLVLRYDSQCTSYWRSNVISWRSMV